MNLQRGPLKTIRATNENANLADRAAFLCPRGEERAHAGGGKGDFRGQREVANAPLSPSKAVVRLRTPEILFASLESERRSAPRVVLMPRTRRKNEPGSCWVASSLGALGLICFGGWREQLQTTFRGEPEHSAERFSHPQECCPGLDLLPAPVTQELSQYGSTACARRAVSHLSTGSPHRPAAPWLKTAESSSQEQRRVGL